MGKVFLSYCHEDMIRVRQLAMALTDLGHSVWWDRQLRAGQDWNDILEKRLDECDAAIVVWSETSRKAEFVLEEASRAKSSGKLVPVLLDPIAPPLGFARIHATDISRWLGGSDAGVISDVSEAIELLAISPPQPKAKRSKKGLKFVGLVVGGKFFGLAFGALAAGSILGGAYLVLQSNAWKDLLVNPQSVSGIGASQPVCPPAALGSGVQSVAFSPDGVLVTAGATGVKFTPIPGAGVKTASLTIDGRRLVTTSGDQTVRLWDTASGKMIRTFTSGQDGAVTRAAFSPDGSKIATASDDKTARIWDVATGREIARLTGHAGALSNVSFAPDGVRLVTTSNDDTAMVWNSVTGQMTLQLRGHQAAVTSAQFSPDGTRLVTTSSDKTAKIWDVRIGTAIATLSGHDGAVSGAAFSPDGRLIVTASDDKTARVWDAGDGKLLLAIALGDGIDSALFTADGAMIFTVSRGKTRLWNAVTGAETASPEVGDAKCRENAPKN